jgi:hypothetical protein
MPVEAWAKECSRLGELTADLLEGRASTWFEGVRRHSVHREGRKCGISALSAVACLDT